MALVTRLAASCLLLAAPALAQEAPSAGVLAARDAHLAKRAQFAHALAARPADARLAPAATLSAAKSGSALPFTRPLPNSRLDIDSFFSTGVTAGDWNSDGLSDIATEGNDGIIVLDQQAGADFAVTAYPGSFGVTMLHGDVNGDGLTDLVDIGSSAWTYPGKAGGGFAAFKKTGLGGAYGWWGALGDCNGDGRADLVFADFFSSCDCVEFGLGLTTGKFGTLSSLPVGPYPGGVALADMNGDGHLDLVTAVEQSTKDQLVVLPGLGDGTFGAALTKNMPQTTFPLDVAVADLDLDGDLDVAVLQLAFNSPTFEAVTSMHGAGDGSFVVHGTYPCSILGNLMTHGDLNADGLQDIAVANYDDFTLLSGGGADILLGTGGGSFAPAVTYDLGGSPESVAAADLDADGDLDLALAQEFQSTIAGEQYTDVVYAGLGLALGRGDGSFPSALGASLGAPVSDAAAADLDGDGAIDLVASLKGSVTGTSALAYELAAAGAFAPPVSVPVATDGHHLAAADLDHDGRADLVLESNLSNGSLRVLHNAGATGPGGPLAFDPAQTLGPSGVDELQLADMDGDGAPDVVTRIGATVQITFNEGFSFTHVASASGDDLGLGLALADVDLDGWCDAVLALPGASAIQVLSDYDGVLLPQPAVGVPSQPISGAAVADFDEDGLPDAAVLSGTKLQVLAGTASGFSSAGSLSLPVATSSFTDLVALDVDRDHAPDLLANSPGAQELVLMRGLGNLSFTYTQSVNAAVGTAALRVADVDGDHFPDVLMPGYDENAVQVLLSQSEFFTDAGHALAASFGTPHLAASGEPFAGQVVSLSVSGVPAQAVGFIVLGTSAVMKPFNGGVLVPAPEAAALVCGTQAVSSVWPVALAGVQVWMQAWFEVGGEFGASNALVCVTQ
jgi:FG-GAP-like repeat